MDGRVPDPAAGAEQDVEVAARSITRDETAGSVALWLGVLGGPVAWAGHLVGNYALEEWFACSPSAQDRGRILGLPVDTVSVGVNTAMLMLAVASMVVALVCLRRGHPDTTAGERAHWMAWAGVVEGLLFSGIILAGYLPPLLLGTCRTTP